VRSELLGAVRPRYVCPSPPGLSYANPEREPPEAFENATGDALRPSEQAAIPWRCPRA
jgi:hypothetical protein